MTMFVVAVLVVIGIGVGVLAGTTTPSHLARPVVAPALFSSLARSGIEGTFSAVYKLSAPTSSAESDATVTVAQRATSGTTAWPGGKPGEWSYRLTYGDGLSVEWLVRGNRVESCWRVRKSKWRCSAGNYSGDVGIGYTIATIPYLPGMAFMSLSIALEAMAPHTPPAVRSEPSSFGRLACVHDPDGTWCLMQDGHLANWTGPGFVGYPWTTARLVSEQPSAPASDFILSRVPRGPWLLPPG